MPKYQIKKLMTTSEREVEDWIGENVDDETQVVVSVSMDSYGRVTCITIKER